MYRHDRCTMLPSSSPSLASLSCIIIIIIQLLAVSHLTIASLPSLDGTCYATVPHIDAQTNNLMRTSHTPVVDASVTNGFVSWNILLSTSNTSSSATLAALYPTNGWSTVANNGSIHVAALKAQVSAPTLSDVVCRQQHSTEYSSTRQSIDWEGGYCSSQIALGDTYIWLQYIEGGANCSGNLGYVHMQQFVTGNFCPRGWAGQYCTIPVIEMPVPTTDYTSDDIILSDDALSMYVAWTMPNYQSSSGTGAVTEPYTWRLSIVPPDPTLLLDITAMALPPPYIPLPAYASSCNRASIFTNNGIPTPTNDYSQPYSYITEFSSYAAANTTLATYSYGRQGSQAYGGVCVTYLDTVTWYVNIRRSANVPAPATNPFRIQFMAAPQCLNGTWSASLSQCICPSSHYSTSGGCNTVSTFTAYAIGAIDTFCCLPCPPGRYGSSCDIEWITPAVTAPLLHQPQSTGGYASPTFFSVPSGNPSNRLAISFTLPDSTAAGSPWLGIFTIYDAYESPLATVSMVATALRTCGDWSVCGTQAIPDASGSTASQRYDATVQATYLSYTPTVSMYPFAIGDAPYASHMPNYYYNNGGWDGSCKCNRSTINPTNQTFTVTISAPNATVGFRYFASCGAVDSTVYIPPAKDNTDGYCTCTSPDSFYATGTDFSQHSYCDRSYTSFPVVTVPMITAASTSVSALASRPAFGQYLYYNISVPSYALIHGLILNLNFTADAATCPGGIGGTYMVKANCLSWDSYYQSCSARDFYTGDVVMYQGDGNYTAAMTMTPMDARDYSCGCNGVSNTGTSYQVRVQMSGTSEFSCNDVLVTASYSDYCMNDGRWQNDESYCLCPEAWEGDRCELSINDPNRPPIFDLVPDYDGSTFVDITIAPSNSTLVRIPTPLGPIKMTLKYTYISGDCSNLGRLVQRTCAGYGAGRTLTSPYYETTDNLKFWQQMILTNSAPSVTYIPLGGVNLYEEGNFTNGIWTPVPNCQKYYLASEMNNVQTFIPYWLRYETLLKNSWPANSGYDTCQIRVRAIMDTSLTPSECNAAYPMKCSLASQCRPQPLMVSSTTNWTNQLLATPSMISRPQLHLNYYQRTELLAGLDQRVDSSNYCECPTGSFGYDCSVTDKRTETFGFNSNNFNTKRGAPVNISLSVSNTNRKLSFTLTHLANTEHSVVCGQQYNSQTSTSYQVCYSEQYTTQDCALNGDDQWNAMGNIGYGYCLNKATTVAQKRAFYITRTIVRARVGAPPPPPVMRYDIVRYPADRVTYERAGLFRVAWTMIGTRNDTHPAIPVFQREFDGALETVSIDFTNGDDNITISTNTYLYLDVVIEGTQEVDGGDDGYGNTYEFNFHVKWTLTDAVGDTVGAIAILILGGVTLGFLIFLYVRSKKLHKTTKQPLGCMGAFRSLLERSDGKREETKANLNRPFSKIVKTDAPKSAGHCCCKWSIRAIFGIIALAAALIFAIITTVFNISLIHAGLSSITIIKTKDIDEIRDGINDALTWLGLPYFGDVFNGLRVYFGWLDFVRSIGLQWNCGGALSMLTPVVLFFGAIFLIFLLQKDFLLRISIRLKGKTQDRGFLSRQIRSKIVMGATAVLLMVLQSAVITLTQVMASVWDIQRSCSEFDKAVVTVGRVLSIVCIIAFFYIAVYSFGGNTIKNRFDCYTLTCGWLRGIIDLLLISVGYWNKTTIDRFEVKERAERYDNDEYDSDNKQQDVMSLLAKSRSLIWLPIPFGVLLAKFCECVNSPPLLIADYKRAGLELYHPFCKRFLMWLVSMARYVLLVGVVFFGGEISCLGSILCTMVYVFLDIMIPNQKEQPLTEAKQVELQRARDAKRAEAARAPPQQITGVHATMDLAHLAPADRYSVEQRQAHGKDHARGASNHVHFDVVVSPTATAASPTPAHHGHTPSSNGGDHLRTPSQGSSTGRGSTGSNHDQQHVRTPSQQQALLSPPNQHNRSSSNTPQAAVHHSSTPSSVHDIDMMHLSPDQRAAIQAEKDKQAAAAAHYSAPSPHLAVPSQGHHHSHGSSGGSIHLQAPPMVAPTPIGHHTPTSSHGGGHGQSFDPRGSR